MKLKKSDFRIKEANGIFTIQKFMGKKMDNGTNIMTNTKTDFITPPFIKVNNKLFPLFNYFKSLEDAKYVIENCIFISNEENEVKYHYLDD
ncbi:hypothetical protein [Aquimarina macrocephali]|uniref:hypothetical protein n=1 Tax=Aquimarina macrocephali TaxID=666563 RepID=UPI003F67B277